MFLLSVPTPERGRPRVDPCQPLLQLDKLPGGEHAASGARE